MILNNDIYINDIKKAISDIKIEELKNKKVFITGSTGLICSSIVDLLIFLNKDKSANISIFAGGRDKEKVKSRFGNNVEFTPYDANEDLKIKNDIDYIIHGAGIADPNAYINNPVETILTTIKGTNNILRYCVNNKKCRVLYISSSEVYGNKSGIYSFSEEDYGVVSLDNIRNSYAESKRMAEILCKSYESEYGVDVLIARPGHIFGPTASKNDQRVSSYFAFQSASGNDIVLKSKGDQLRSYCYCLECANAIIKIILNGISGESYNISNDNKVSIKEMANIYAKSAGVKVVNKAPITKEIESFNPMVCSCLNNKKIKSIGYKCIFDIEESFDHTIKIIKNINK